MQTCTYCDQAAWYRDRASGDYLCVNHARLEVAGPRRPARKAPLELLIRPSGRADRKTILSIWRHFWREVEMDCFGRVYRAAELPALLLCDGKRVVGLLSYAVEREWDAINIVALNLLPDYQGSGGASALLGELEALMQRLGIGRLIVATANDNPLALTFYQQRGFTISGILVGVIRPDGPDDDLIGMAGIPVRDEIQLEKRL